MREEALAALIGFGQTFTKIIPISIGMAVVFTVLTSFWPATRESRGGVKPIS